MASFRGASTLCVSEVAAQQCHCPDGRGAPGTDLYLDCDGIVDRWCLSVQANQTCLIIYL